ncbi:nuclear transport factor 2 family protein [Mesorhizobium sp. A556]
MALINLPHPIAAFVNAANACNLDGLVATFAAAALVNDQLNEHWGQAAIREWAESEMIAYKLTIFVVRVVEHYGHSIVTANVDGDYDKRGLPEPLVLTFYFSAVAGKIVQLFVLRNLSDM